MVFWPPALLLVIAVLYGIVAFDQFLAITTAANSWILGTFDWLFTGASFVAVLILVAVFISPLGKVRLGGHEAKPILSRWNWFAITLCTTVAIGILVWGPAEPIFHHSAPPGFTGHLPESPEAARFAMSSLFLHWTITPYCLYAMIALAFALAFHNHGRAYSISSPITLLFGSTVKQGWHDGVDAISVFALVAGVAAALGVGVMSIAGGLERLAGIPDTLTSRILITLTIVTAFIISSVSGLQRGIKWLSDINARIFIAIALFVFVMGPTLEIMQLAAFGFKDFIVNFIPASLPHGARAADPWTQDWTVFFFANWLAWAPVTALFLGRIAIGYTVREFLTFNVLIPVIFSTLWMSILGGAALELNHSEGGTLTRILQSDGTDAIAYALLSSLPAFSIVGSIFLITLFISFVTAMDSNTLSLSGLFLKNSAIAESSFSAENKIKIFSGALIGSVSIVMTGTTGIEGVRMLSNLGGLPGLFILILSGALLVKLMISSIRTKDS